MIQKPLTTVIVKTAGSHCNLNCSYCFYLKKDLKFADEKVMDDETLEVFIRQIMEQSGNAFGIVWQGGEPTLAGAGFFRKAISLMQGFGYGKHKLISNLLQTNGYFLSDKLMDVLSEYSFLTGLSLDGPEEIHDTYRKTESGKGSWKQVMNSWEKLEARQIATNILCCITSDSAKQAERMYNFFKQHQMLWLQFIPVSETGKNGELEAFSVSPKDWGQFMCEVFDRWYMDFIKNQQSPSIRFIENAFYAHLGMSSPECTFAESCGNYLVLEQNGDVFSCDFLVGNETRLGNIHQKKLIDMLNNPQQIHFGNAKKNIHGDCISCSILKYCHGGCPKYRDVVTQKYYYCESWKMFLTHSEIRLQKLVEEYKRKNPDFWTDTLDISGHFQ